MRKYAVVAARDLPPGHRLIVDVAGMSVGVFNVAGDFYAARNRCPHQGGPLCEGLVVFALTSRSPGEFHYDMSEPFVQCPWHNWEFSLRDGQSWFDPSRTRVRSYAITLEPLGSGNEAPSERASGSVIPYTRSRGPYAAETYPVAVEDDYVVITLRS